jgi:hypothetical protein
MGTPIHPGLLSQISSRVPLNEAGIITVEQSAMPRSLAYAGAVSRVLKNRTAQPRRLRAKMVRTISMLEGARIATTGALSWCGSYIIVSIGYDNDVFLRTYCYHKATL